MQTILLYTAFFAPVIPILIGSRFYFKLSVIQKMLFWMTVTVFLNQILSLIWTHLLGKLNNMPFFHVYVIIEFFALTFIFQHLINRGHRFRKITNVILLAFGLFWVIQLFWGNKKWEYPSDLLISESVFVLIYALNYFRKTFKDGLVVNLLQETGFWVSFGLILYFASNTLLFLFGEFVVKLSDASFSVIWTIHGVLTISLYISYAIALRCK